MRLSLLSVTRSSVPKETVPCAPCSTGSLWGRSVSARKLGRSPMADSYVIYYPPTTGYSLPGRSHLCRIGACRRRHLTAKRGRGPHPTARPNPATVAHLSRLPDRSWNRSDPRLVGGVTFDPSKAPGSPLMRIGGCVALYRPATVIPRGKGRGRMCLRVWYWATIDREGACWPLPRPSIPDLWDLAAYGDTDKDAIAHVTELASERVRAALDDGQRVPLRRRSSEMPSAIRSKGSRPSL